MYSIKSPGGSMFPYYYKGGELHCLKYGSFYSNEEALLTLMKEEEDFIKKPNRRIRVWVDFYKTDLTGHIGAEFAASICRLQEHVVKLAIVGCSFSDKRNLNKQLRHYNCDRSFPIKYYSDPEEAKTWLVCDGGAHG